MSELFEIDGPNVDQVYRNLREDRLGPERAIRLKLEKMWELYKPFADPDFKEGFARDPEARFWEIYLGCELISAGKTLLPRSKRQTTGGQPDICLLEGDRRIWIEAIAPDCGSEGPDQVRGPKPINQGGGFEPVPKRQAQLRLTSALWTKGQILKKYIDSGVIHPEDVRLIAIGGGRFGRSVPDSGLPLIMSSVFPIGDEIVTIDREKGNVLDIGFVRSERIHRHQGSIPRTAFTDKCFSDVSAVIWSRISIGNITTGGRPLTLVHNPLAAVPMPQSWNIWNHEYVASLSEDGFAAEDIVTRTGGNR